MLGAAGDRRDRHVQAVIEADHRPAGLISRRRPLDRLLRSGARILVVQAPAGFGKTVLLQQYADTCKSRGDRVAWVRVDAQAYDPGPFLEMLASTLAGGDFPARERTGPRSVPELIELLNAPGRRTLLVLDNFEHAMSPAIDSLFAQLLRELPRSVQLCIGTRVLPSRRLVALQVTGDTEVIDEAALAFSPGETFEFFQGSPGLQPAQVAEIHAWTNGWPVALQCVRLCLSRGRMRRAEAVADRGITRELIDFLTTEVLENLDPALRNFLLEICLPERLNAELVEHLTGRPDSAEALQAIENAGLFLSPLGPRSDWVRFHNLFRRCLLARLQRDLSDREIAQRHVDVANWLIDQGRQEDAVEHLLAAGRSEAAAALLDGIINQFVVREQLELIERFVDRIPDDVLLRFRSLTAAAIIAYGFRRYFERANSLVEQLHAVVGGDPESPEQAELNFAHLFMLAAQDRFEELNELAERTWAQTTDEDAFKRGVCLNAQSIWLAGQGRFEEVQQRLELARSLHEKSGHYMGLAYCEAIHSMVLSSQGRIPEAGHRLANAMQVIERGAVGGVSGGSVLAAYLAEHAYENNDLDQAAQLLDDFGALIEQHGVVDPLATSLLVGARIARAQGDFAEMESIIDRMAYLGFRHSTPRLVGYARAESIRHATLVGDLDLAQERLDRWRAEQPAFSSDKLMFHAGEAEACHITEWRLMIAQGDHVHARGRLAPASREARSARRIRRLLKLRVLTAMSLNASGRVPEAQRALLEALDLGLAGGMLRSLLDEQQPLIRLLRELYNNLQSQPELPEQDGLKPYLVRLLRAAGESLDLPQASVLPQGPDEVVMPLEPLTEKERRVLTCVARGLSNRDAADRLCVSTNTIKWHLRNVFEKLGITNRVQAVAVARHLGLIE